MRPRQPRRLDLAHLAVIGGGDRSTIESDLRALPIDKKLKIVQFNAEFRLVPVERGERVRKATPATTDREAMRERP